MIRYVRLFVLVLILSSCSPQPKLVKEKWFPNPNGESELALTMRDMYDAMKEMKFRLDQDKKVKSIPNFDNLLTATPTGLSMKKESFDAFANSWLNSLEKMNTNSLKNQKENYRNLVNTCIGCHDQSCPGPIKRIVKLKLSSVKD